MDIKSTDATDPMRNVEKWEITVDEEHEPILSSPNGVRPCSSEGLDPSPNGFVLSDLFSFLPFEVTWYDVQRVSLDFIPQATSLYKSDLIPRRSDAEESGFGNMTQILEKVKTVFQRSFRVER